MQTSIFRRKVGVGWGNGGNGMSVGNPGALSRNLLVRVFLAANHRFLVFGLSLVSRGEDVSGDGCKNAKTTCTRCTVLHQQQWYH